MLLPVLVMVVKRADDALARHSFHHQRLLPFPLMLPAGPMGKPQ